ncbi:MAG: sigma-70 family RNA polymerase sigma factor [Salinibacterium sp.]|nr:sigma-70 family RNA polymerase sigma factor [Salinibacterium sp.]
MHPDDVPKPQGSDSGFAGANSEELFERLYTDLRRFAHSQMRFERASGVMQPTTALVHEAWIRLVDEQDRLESRAHFFAAVAQTMRRLLIDQARQRNALKRGGDRKRVPLDVAFSSREDADTDLLALDEVLQKLERTDPMLHQIVMLRFFVGLRIEQLAEAVGRSPRSVKRDWTRAKEWLQVELASANEKFVDPPGE